jgi:CDP-diacylglycerol--serine O-phosphatidyltransferase
LYLFKIITFDERKAFSATKRTEKMKKITRSLAVFFPNMLTATNLFLGAMATYYAFTGYSPIAANLIIIAAVLDFFDGFFARLLKAQTELGKQFDSLADLISFGLAPAAILFDISSFDRSGGEWIYHNENILPFFIFVMLVFSALRLARFNIDTKQQNGFLGLPTPANALFIASLPLMMMELCPCTLFFQQIANIRNILIYVALISLLMNIPVPMLSLKMKSLKWKENAARYIFLFFVIIAVLVIYFGTSFTYPFILAFVLAFYLLYSLIVALLQLL